MKDNKGFRGKELLIKLAPQIPNVLCFAGNNQKGGQGGVGDKSKQIQNHHQKKFNGNRPKDGKTDNRPFNKLKGMSQNKHHNSGKQFNKFKDGNRPPKSFDSKDGKKPFNKFSKPKDNGNQKFKDSKDIQAKEFSDKKTEKLVPADKTVNFVLSPKKLEQRIKEVKQMKQQEIMSEKKTAYQQKKSMRNDIYTQTTKRNQPVMAGRMKLLYGQLKQSFGIQE